MTHAVCTIAMSTSVPIDYGVARVAKDGKVAYLDEKSVPKKYLVSIGMDVVEREVLLTVGISRHQT
jgi:hypothetical protein